MTDKNRLVNITRDQISDMANGDPRMIRALEELFRSTGGAAWDKIDFTDSNLTDILTRNHNDLQFNNKAVITDYTLSYLDDVVLVDATAGDIIITMPSVAIATGSHSIKKIDATVNTVTIVPAGADTVEDDVSLIVSQQYDAPLLAPYGTNWSVV